MESLMAAITPLKTTYPMLIVKDIDANTTVRKPYCCNMRAVNARFCIVSTIRALALGTVITII